MPMFRKEVPKTWYAVSVFHFKNPSDFYIVSLTLLH